VSPLTQLRHHRLFSQNQWLGCRDVTVRFVHSHRRSSPCSSIASFLVTWLFGIFRTFRHVYDSALLIKPFAVRILPLDFTYGLAGLRFSFAFHQFDQCLSTRNYTLIEIMETDRHEASPIGTRTNTVVLAFTVIAGLVVTLRIFGRLIPTRLSGLEDVWIVIALVSFTTTYHYVT
jgi:hypothetical protein